MLDTVLNDLRNDNIISLDLKFKELGDVKVSQILKLAESSSVLKSLNLTDNDISVEGSVKLSEFVKKNSSVTELILDLNPLSISQLAAGLRYNTTLKALQIGFQNPTLDDFRVLFTALSVNDSVCNLGLSDVGLKADSAMLLGRYIRSTTALCKLYIARNQLDGVGLHHVIANLRFNTSLVELNINRVYLDAVSITAMERFCQNSYNLSRLYTNQNIRNVQQCLRRNRVVAQKISDLVTPKTEGIDYTKAVYELDVTFWDISSLFKGGFAAVNNCSPINEKRKFNLERLFGYLFVRDYVLADITNEKFKRAKYLLIIGRAINYAPGDHSDRHLLNIMAHGITSDRNAQNRLAFMINPIIKSEYKSEQISAVADALNSNELKFIIDDATRLQDIIQQAKDMAGNLNSRPISRMITEEEKEKQRIARKIALSLPIAQSAAIN